MEHGTVLITDAANEPLDELYDAVSHLHHKKISRQELWGIISGLYNATELRQLFNRYTMVSHRHLAIAWLGGEQRYLITDRRLENVSLNQRILATWRKRRQVLFTQLEWHDIELMIAIEEHDGETNGLPSGFFSAGEREQIRSGFAGRFGSSVELSLATVEELRAEIEELRLQHIVQRFAQEESGES